MRQPGYEVENTKRIIALHDQRILRDKHKAKKEEIKRAKTKQKIDQAIEAPKNESNSEDLYFTQIKRAVTNVVDGYSLLKKIRSQKA